jgi:hypothetical protein
MIVMIDKQMEDMRIESLKQTALAEKSVKALERIATALEMIEGQYKWQSQGPRAPDLVVKHEWIIGLK